VSFNFVLIFYRHSIGTLWTEVVFNIYCVRHNGMDSIPFNTKCLVQLQEYFGLRERTGTAPMIQGV
jgi:hypothetical protein